MGGVDPIRVWCAGGCGYVDGVYAAGHIGTATRMTRLTSVGGCGPKPTTLMTGPAARCPTATTKSSQATP